MGAAITIGMPDRQGSLQVLDSGAATSKALAGISGLGHMTLTAAFCSYSPCSPASRHAQTARAWHWSPGEAATDTDSTTAPRHLAANGAHQVVLTRRPRLGLSMIVLDGTIVGVALPGSSPTCTSTWPTPNGSTRSRDDLRRAAPHRQADRRSLGTPPDLRRQGRSLRHLEASSPLVPTPPPPSSPRAPSRSRRRARPSVHPVDGQRDLPRQDRATAFGILGAVMAGMGCRRSPARRLAHLEFRLALDLLRQRPHQGRWSCSAPSSGCPRRAEHRAGCRRRRPPHQRNRPVAHRLPGLIEGSTYGGSGRSPTSTSATGRGRRQLPSHRLSSPSSSGPSSSGSSSSGSVTGHAIAATPSSISASSPCAPSRGQPHGRRRRRGRVRAGLRAAALPRQRSRPGHHGRRLGPAAMAIGAFVSGAQARHLAARLSPDQGRPPRPGLGSPASPPCASPLLDDACLGGRRAARRLRRRARPGLGPADLHRPGRRSARAVGSGSATQARPDSVGSALGTALVGSTLAASPRAHTVAPTRLADIAGFPPPSRPNSPPMRPRPPPRPYRDGPPGDDRTARRPRPADRGRWPRVSPTRLRIGLGVALAMLLLGWLERSSLIESAYRDRHGPRRRRARRRIAALPDAARARTVLLTGSASPGLTTRQLSRPSSSASPSSSVGMPRGWSR